MTDISAPSTQRPATGRDRLSIRLQEPVWYSASAEIEQTDALDQSALLLAEAERGDLASWQLDRAIDLACLFPGDTQLQFTVGRLVRIMKGTREAAVCWRNMAGRFPDSAQIMAEYLHVLREMYGNRVAREIVAAYADPRPEQSSDKHPPSRNEPAREPAREPASVSVLRELIDHALDRRARQSRSNHARLGAVAIIGSTLGGGGAERQLVTTALGLNRMPARRLAGPITIYCRKLDARRGNDFYLPMLEQAGVRVVDYRRTAPFAGGARASLLNDHASALLQLPPHMREGTEKLTDLLRHDAPDVVQIWQDGSIFAAGLAALLAGVPRIVLCARTMPPTARIDRQRPEQATLYKGLLKAPGVLLTANSRIAARAYEDWLDLAPGNVAVVPNGVEPLPSQAPSRELDLWKDFERRTGAGFILGGVMRFDDNKRPLEWLAIAADLARRLPAARFVLIGDGPLRDAAETFAHRAGIAERTLFVGRSAAVGFWLGKLDALALTSRQEGTPNVLIEAQLAGVPVVATPAGGAPDAVAPYAANCILSDAERLDRATAVGHLVALSARSPEQIATDANGLASWCERFSVSAMLDRTLSLFGAAH